MGEQTMISEKKRLAALFVDRFSNQWVVRDPEGNFWIVPSVENGWDHREPFYPTEETELEPVPGHLYTCLTCHFNRRKGVHMNAEQIRLEEAREHKAPWKKWGPYLSERQWGTVRED